MPLNDVKVRNLALRERPYKLFDGDGLHIVVHPNGSKYWRLKYRFGKKEKTLAIGVYPEVSLKEARDKAVEARRLLSDGKDPSLAKQESKRQALLQVEHAFAVIAKEWWQQHQHKWSDGHAHSIWRRLENNIFPKLGKTPIADISRLQLLEVIKVVEKRGAHVLAHKLLQHCSGIFRYAALYGKVERNITADLSGALKSHKTTNYPTLTAADLPEFLACLHQHTTSQQNKIAMQLLLATFVRQGELRKALWTEFDEQEALWRIPALRMKMREEHRVPLSSYALQLLAALRPLTGHSSYLFPSQNRQKNPYMSENTLNKIIKDMGYKDRLVAHGVRALASTILNEHGFRVDVIERQLAHVEPNKVRAAYNRAEYLDERRHMMEWWGNYLQNILPVV